MPYLDMAQLGDRIDAHIGETIGGTDWALYQSAVYCQD